MNNCLSCGSGLSDQEPVKRVPGGYLCECCGDEPIELAGWKAYWIWMLKEWETVLCVVALIAACLWGIEVSR